MTDTPMYSTPTNPKLEFALEIRLKFPNVHHLGGLPSGISRSAVYVQEGTFEGPTLKGKALPNSGGDWAAHWPSKTLALDARYMLQEDDGTLIYLQNKGFIWGRKEDTMQKFYDYAFNNGPAVPHEEYYFRTQTTFEVPPGKHDWMNNHVFVGIGERLQDGNCIRYFAVV